MIVLDTTVVSEAMRANRAPEVRDWLNAQAIPTLHITTVTLAELRTGIAVASKGRKTGDLNARFDRMMQVLVQDRILPFDAAVADAYSTGFAAARAAGLAPTVPIEVFYSVGFRSGSDMEFTVQDACVLISLLLQYGVPPERIASPMATRDSDDADLTSGEFAQPTDGPVIYGSLAGTIAAELAVPPGWAGDAK